jgi:glyoxylase-like metal-dependent hydrolase (beta-lactamase superfamily II)
MNRFTQLSPMLHAVERWKDGALDVRGLVLTGDRYTIVFDTLYSPRDMAAVLDLAAQRRRPVLVIDSHADYDHAWGNGAFPNASIVGHIACRERLVAEGPQLDEKRREDPDEYATSRLIPPDIVFDHTLSIDAGGFTVVLHHLPGHTRDCLVAHVPEQRLLLTGDTAELPFPLLGDGPIDDWIAALERWAADPRVETVIPAHGPVSGTELLRANARYLATLAEGRDDGWTPGEDAPEFYRRMHPRNVARAAELRAPRAGIS